MSAEYLRHVAVVVLVAIGSSVAQQQPQEPKLHGFKARLCAMTTVPYSPAWDHCMAAGFGKPHPSQPPQPAAAPRQLASASQQVASAPQQVPPQPKLQEPIANGTPVQTPVQTAAQVPAQAAAQVPAQAAAQVPVQTAAQVPAQAAAQVPVQTPVQTTAQAPEQGKTCMEYMTTLSGAQTCLRFENDKDK
jgi:hypothetical protein